MSQYIEKIENLKRSKLYKEARELIEKCLSKYSDDYRLYEELADVYLYEWDIFRAQQAAKYGQELSPKSATGLYLLGYILLVEEKYSESVKFLQQANKYNPNNPEVLRNLGWAYVMLGEVEKGIIFLERALHLSPRDDLIIEDLGRALIIKGDILGGKEYLKRISNNKKQ